jgi:hypothetical protein
VLDHVFAPMKASWNQTREWLRRERLERDDRYCSAAALA